MNSQRKHTTYESSVYVKVRKRNRHVENRKQNCKKHFKTCYIYCQQKCIYLHLVNLKMIYNILTGSNGRSSNSDPVHSTDLHPEGQERVSIILTESAQ